MRWLTGDFLVTEATQKFIWVLECLSKKGLYGKIAGAKMRGPENFPKDTDWILSVNIRTKIKSNELVAVATV